MYKVLGNVSEIEKIKEILHMFSEKSQTCKKLLKQNVTINFVATGQSESGGQAQGNDVIIDLKSSSSDGRMTAKEAAESALFEVQNMRHRLKFKNLKDKLFAGQMTLSAYGDRMVETEHESTHAVAKILGEVKSSFTSSKSVKASVKPPRPDLNKGYRPSIWGAKQCANDIKGWRHAATTPHSKNPAASLVMKLKSSEKYAFEVVRDAKVINNLLKKMVKLIYIYEHQSIPFDVGQFVSGVNLESVSIYCAFLGLLSTLESSNNWKVSWTKKKEEWQFSKDMINAAGVNKKNLKDYAKYILKRPLEEVRELSYKI